MITSKDLNKEIEILDKIAKVKEEDSNNQVLSKAVVKALTLILKVLQNVRANQVIELTKKYGKDILAKSKGRREAVKKEEKK